jgi:hypothetical protein
MLKVINQDLDSLKDIQKILQKLLNSEGIAKNLTIYLTAPYTYRIK